MGKIDLAIPLLRGNFIDLRDPIPGDSYNWSWTRPLAQVKYLAIHHTAGPDTQTPDQIANFHIQSNGWGGIGYHFLIAKNGTIYYVGDISTARANVSNLNEQVLGICLIGNFMGGKNPTDEQLDSTHKLCDYFINHYPALSNVQSWDAVRGHKDLPGQSTACPGDKWPEWRSKIIGTTSSQPIAGGSVSFNGSNNRKQQIADLYRIILGREPDTGSLDTYNTSPLSIEEIMKTMVSSQEHKNLLNLAKEVKDYEVRVASLQDTVNKQKTEISSAHIHIAALEEELALLNRDYEKKVSTAPLPLPNPEKKDTTFTLVDALFNLYKLISNSLSRKAVLEPS